MTVEIPHACWNAIRVSIWALLRHYLKVFNISPKIFHLQKICFQYKNIISNGKHLRNDSEMASISFLGGGKKNLPTHLQKRSIKNPWRTDATLFSFYCEILLLVFPSMELSEDTDALVSSCEHQHCVAHTPSCFTGSLAVLPLGSHTEQRPNNTDCVFDTGHGSER